MKLKEAILQPSLEENEEIHQYLMLARIGAMRIHILLVEIQTDTITLLNKLPLSDTVEHKHNL